MGSAADTASAPGFSFSVAPERTHPGAQFLVQKDRVWGKRKESSQVPVGEGRCLWEVAGVRGRIKETQTLLGRQW